MKKVTAFATPAAVFLVSFAFFLLLRSNDFFAVDGSFRCLEVFRDPSLFFQSNNHLLYTPDVYGWIRLAALAGLKPAGPVEFLHLVEVMNCLAGAIALSLFCSLVLGVTDSWLIAVGTTAGLALTRAFLGQATNSNEPMPGILWSFAGMALAARSVQKRSLWAALASGLAFGLAMAAYRSMVLLAPAAALLLLVGDAEAPPRFTHASGRLWRTLAFTVATVLSIAALHGWAYWSMGERRAGGFISRFAATDGSQFYFGLRWSRFLNLPIGMARNFFAVEPEFTGIRHFLAGPLSAIVVMITFILAIFAFFIFCGLEIKSTWPVIQNCERLAVMCSCVGFAFTFLPVVLWDPQYDKLWVLPLACLLFPAATALNRARWDGPYRKSIAWILAVVAVWGVSITLRWTYKNHVRDPIEFQEAKQASSIFGKDDFVVGDWRPVATLYGYLYAEPDHFLSFPSEAVKNGSPAIVHVRSAVSETKAKGGNVFFFDTLDMPREVWNFYFGRIPGAPYSVFDEYRARATLRTRFLDKHGYDNLWELK
jgi:hypothetical protein